MSELISISIICFSVLCGLLILVKSGKGFNLKSGDKSLSLGEKNAVIKVVTDYGDFKAGIREIQDRIREDLNAYAAHFAEVRIDQYMIRLITGYSSSVEDQTLTSIVTLLIRLLKIRLIDFFKDIYDHNHLNEENVKEIAKDDYERMTDIFRQEVKLSWFPILGDYSLMEDVCIRTKPFASNMTSEILEEFVKLSQARTSLINRVNEYDKKVRTYTVEKGHLPEGAISSLSTLYEGNGVINEQCLIGVTC